MVSANNDGLKPQRLHWPGMTRTALGRRREGVCDAGHVVARPVADRDVVQGGVNGNTHGVIAHAHPGEHAVVAPSKTVTVSSAALVTKM